MFNIFINNINVQVQENATILDAASQINIHIPTMCFAKELKPSASCMICMVKDKTTGKFLASCSALVQEGMQIETDSDEIKILRKNALELLLSDHRGDCEAPCQRACPSHIDIPKMNRQVASDNFNFANPVTEKSCENCDAPCEKVCRRKSIDSPVAIMQIRNYTNQNNFKISDKNKTKSVKKFNSTYGKIRENDKSEFLKEAENKRSRIEPKNILSGYIKDEAIAEAKRCMHCDCRKSNSCTLRNLSHEYDAKQQSYQLDEKKIIEKIFYQNSVIYEPEKCIKCGICIQITEKTEDVAFAFIGRGFNVKVSVPFNDKINKALSKSATECVKFCPTGSLAFK